MLVDEKCSVCGAPWTLHLDPGVPKLCRCPSCGEEDVWLEPADPDDLRRFDAVVAEVIRRMHDRRKE